MNKIIVSIIFTILIIFVINKITDAVFFVEKPEKSAYEVAGITTVASTTASEANSETAGVENIVALLASASIVDGEKVVPYLL